MKSSGTGSKDWLYVEQSKQNLQQDIPFPDVESEEIQESAHAETDPLVLEMQEHARELAKESGYAPDERFVATMTGENFPDSKDAFAIWDYVKEEYYGYSDGKVQTFADYVSASEALQEIRGRNMEAEKEPATVQPEPAAPVQPDYRVGDTLYLDGKAFTIEKSGFSMWNFGTRIPCIRSSARKARKIWQEFWGMRKMFTCTIWWLI